MKPKVLISAPYFQNDIKLFEEELTSKGIDFELYPVKERMEEDELLSHLPPFNALVCGDDRVTKKVIDACPQLKVIVKWGTGIDSIDKIYAATNGIPVYRTPNAFTEPVSDSVLGYLLVYARSINVSDRLMKAGKWAKTRGYTLAEQTLGIIGLGDVGMAVARKASAFGMTIIANDIAAIPKAKYEAYGVTMVSKDELLAKADYVSLNCDLNKSSHHIIAEKELDLMQTSSILINTARGSLVSEPDLVYALQKGLIAGAALDVFEEEPLPANSPLRGMDNCLLSSHNVNVSPLFWGKVHRNTIDMLYKGLQIETH